MAKKEEKKGSYGAADITVLEGLEAVRRRPGMYIGTTAPDGLHHLICELFDNSHDEAMGDSEGGLAGEGDGDDGADREALVEKR